MQTTSTTLHNLSLAILLFAGLALAGADCPESLLTQLISNLAGVAILAIAAMASGGFGERRGE